MLCGREFMARSARPLKGLIEARLELIRQHSLGPHLRSAPPRSVRFWAVYLRPEPLAPSGRNTSLATSMNARNLGASAARRGK